MIRQPRQPRLPRQPRQPRRVSITLSALLSAVAACSLLHVRAVHAAADGSDLARGKQWWAHVQVLADDSMKGRLTGSPEYLRAAAYVVGKFKSYGLQPAGVNGFYQPVHFEVQRVIAEKSSIGLIVEGKPEPLALGKDATLGARSPEPQHISAPLVFIGYGLHLPESIDADLNLDMFMPIFALKKLHVQGLEQSTLAEDARKAGAAHNIIIAGDPEPDRNSFIRTDQYSFVQAGVPALAMKFGWQAGSPEYKAWRAWLAERYHSTADDLNQPVDLEAAAQFNSFFADLAREVANNPAREHYLPTSFFHRFEAVQ